MIEYPGTTPGRGGWYRNEAGLALVSHPNGGKRQLAYSGASSLWPFDPYNGPAIYGERGSHMHALCDLADQGAPLPDDFIAAGDALGISAELQAYIYTRWTVFLKAHGLKVVGVEVPVVNDEHRVATNIDRVLEVGSRHHSADIKSSGDVVKPGYLLQQAVSVTAVPYDIQAAERREWETPLFESHAYILHFPLTAAIKADSRDDWPDWSLVSVALAPGRQLLRALMAVRDTSVVDCFTQIAAPSSSPEVEQPATDGATHGTVTPSVATPTLDELRAEAAEIGRHDPEFTTRLLAYFERNEVDRTDAAQVDEAIRAVVNFRDVQSTAPPPAPAETPPAALSASDDEGDPLDEATIEAAKRRYLALDDAARSWVAHCAARVRLSPDHGGKATTRRMEILRGLCELGESDGFDTDDFVKGICAHLLGDIVWQGPKVPDILAALTLAEATRFAQMCDVLTTGDIAVNWTEDRRCVLSASLAEVAAA